MGCTSFYKYTIGKQHLLPLYQEDINSYLSLYDKLPLRFFFLYAHMQMYPVLQYLIGEMGGMGTFTVH